MIWLLSKLFGQFVPILSFIGDHRWGGVALLCVAAAAASWVYLPVVGRQTAKALLVIAVGFATFDWGYSHRAAIDRDAWRQAEAARLAAELAEHVRRDEAITKARRDADSAEAALHAQMEEHAKYMVETENASKAADHDPCLSGAGVMRLDRIGRRKKAR